jgi:hypothetical protein
MKAIGLLGKAWPSAASVASAKAAVGNSTVRGKRAIHVFFMRYPSSIEV